MSFAGLLRHRCDIIRAVKTGYGQSGSGPSTVASNVPCLRQSAGGSEVLKDGQMVDANMRIFLGFGVDVTEKDVIRWRQSATATDAIDHEVKLVDADAAGAAHHMEILCKEVRI